VLNGDAVCRAAIFSTARSRIARGRSRARQALRSPPAAQIIHRMRCEIEIREDLARSLDRFSGELGGRDRLSQLASGASPAGDVS
jgi:hypothetical protein